MDRLTIPIGECYSLKCLSNNLNSNCRDYCEHNADCEYCGIQLAFDKLAAYEDTGFSPEDIVTMKADNDRLHKLLCEAEDILRKDGRDD